MSRRTVTFPVRAEFTERTPAGTYDKVTRWVKSDGTLTANADEAIRFTLHRSPTPAEKHRIEAAMHELAGGLEQWLDLEQGIAQTQAKLVAELEDELWPDGRPEATGPALLEQQNQLGQAWDKDVGQTRRGLTTMLGMQDRLRFLASWPVLAVDMPDEWRKIADMELSDKVFEAVWNAYTEAAEASFLEQQRSSAP